MRFNIFSNIALITNEKNLFLLMFNKNKKKQLL